MDPMDKKSERDSDGLYRVDRCDDNLSTNLHRLYDDITKEPVPEYLMELLRKLPN